MPTKARPSPAESAAERSVHLEFVRSFFSRLPTCDTSNTLLVTEEDVSSPLTTQTPYSHDFSSSEDSDFEEHNEQFSTDTLKRDCKQLLQEYSQQQEKTSDASLDFSTHPESLVLVCKEIRKTFDTADLEHLIPISPPHEWDFMEEDDDCQVDSPRVIPINELSRENLTDMFHDSGYEWLEPPQTISSITSPGEKFYLPMHSSDPLCAGIVIHGKLVVFNCDTGAQGTIISKESLDNLQIGRAHV